MAQTSRSTDIKATRAMRDATNSVAPRDIAPKPPAEGKENNKDDGFFFADPAGLTTPAPALPAKTMDPSPTSVLMGPGTPDEAAEQRPREKATPEKATDDAEMTLATSDVASPESPELPATVPDLASPRPRRSCRTSSRSSSARSSPGPRLRANPTSARVAMRRTSPRTGRPPDRPRRAATRRVGCATRDVHPDVRVDAMAVRPIPGADRLRMGREWAASGTITPGRSTAIPTFLDDLVNQVAKVAVDTKGTNTESNNTDEWDRTDNLKVECERLKREVDFHREVSKEVGVSLDATSAELERTKRRVEFLESLKDEWDAQFKDLSAETERYRAEAEAAREETLAAEALAAAARAAATSANAEAESLRKNVISDDGSTGEAPETSGTTSTSVRDERRDGIRRAVSAAQVRRRERRRRVHRRRPSRARVRTGRRAFTPRSNPRCRRRRGGETRGEARGVRRAEGRGERRQERAGRRARGALADGGGAHDHAQR